MVAEAGDGCACGLGGLEDGRPCGGEGKTRDGQLVVGRAGPSRGAPEGDNESGRTLGDSDLQRRDVRKEEGGQGQLPGMCGDAATEGWRASSEG